MHLFLTRIPVFLLLTCTCLAVSGCIVNPVPTPGTTASDESGKFSASDASIADSGAASDALTGSSSGGSSGGTSSGGTFQDAATPSDAGAEDAGANADAGAEDAEDSGKSEADDASDPKDAGSNCTVVAPLDVLFLGNSYTFFNDLPTMLQNVSANEGHDLLAESVTKGGWTLGAKPNAHSQSKESLDKLHAKPWDVVVLQEQSQIPTIPYFQKQTMVPGAKALTNHLRQVNQCAVVALFQTWGRKKGGKQCAGSQCSADFKDFGQMQNALTAAYADVAKQVGGIVVPVGEVFRVVIEQGGPDLFDPDGSHPSLAGSYLAALTFHAVLFKQTPSGKWKPAGIDSGDVGVFLKAVATVVK